MRDAYSAQSASVREQAHLASGLETSVEPLPETEKEFADRRAQLRQVDPGDLESKLVIAG